MIRSRYAIGVVRITFLLWDDANIAHVAGHGVVPAEVEQAVFLDSEARVYEAGKAERAGRIVIFGHAATGRPLVVLLDRPSTEGNAYVVSARPPSRQERRDHFTEEA